MIGMLLALSLASIAVIAILVSSAFIAALALWGRYDVSRFLVQHPAIESDTSLEAFKDLVRRQMKVALAAMVLGLTFGLLCMFVTMQLLLTGFLIVIVLGAVIFLLGRSGKKLETKARNLVCSDERRKVEYDKVAAAWTGKLFPNF
jgi:amino acid transporter